MIELAHSGLSVAYVNQGDFSKGEAGFEILYRAATRMMPGSTTTLDTSTPSKWKKPFEQAGDDGPPGRSRRSPMRVRISTSLGWVLFKRGKVKEAVEPLEKAIKNLSGSGGDATIYEHLGDVYFQLQEHAKAKAAWEQAEKSAVKAVPFADKRLLEIRKKLESLRKLAPKPPKACRPGDTP